LLNEQNVFIGYTSSIDTQPIGVNVMFLNGKNIGAYLDVKFGFLLPSSFRETAPEFDEYLKTEIKYRTANIGITKVISKNSIYFIGIGFTKSTNYDKYYRDDTGDFSELKYYVLSNKQNNGKINILGGFMFELIDGLMIQFGIQSYPQNIIIGFNFGLKQLGCEL